MNKTTPHALPAKALLLGGFIGSLSVALMSSCSTPAPYIYVAPQKAPVEYKETKPKTTPTIAKVTTKKEDPRAKSFSLEERVRLEPVQAGGGGEELSTTIIKGNSN